jgi:N utilization substance protein B
MSDPRERAFEALYEHEQRGGTEPLTGRAGGLIEGVIERRTEIDEVLEKAASNWSPKRMALVDVTLLRLATFELMATDTPTAVIINEAIELAKQFSTEQSAGFVNGVLASVAVAIRPNGEAD